LEKNQTVADDFKKGMKKISFAGQDFLFLSQKIDSPGQLQLWPNFDGKASSADLFKNYRCRFLINGGFYDQQNQPLGWFLSQEKLRHPQIKSALLNGFFFQNQQKEIGLEDVLPVNEVVWGLQTGPILIFKGKPLKLQMAKDERARRMVVALGQSEELLFLAVTGPDSLASGPLLADLPFIAEKIGQALRVDFKTAINLDGGTASAFLNSEKTIKEYNSIGSFFCLN